MKKIAKTLCVILSLGWGALPLAHAEGDPTTSKGVGPVKELRLETVSPSLSAKGKTTFISKCSACHKLEERYVGPGLKSVTKRRTPEWIMNMILNPKEMLEQDDTAKELLGEYLTQMTFQNVSQDDARAILEYFREYDEKGPSAGGVDEKAKSPDKKSAKKPIRKISKSVKERNSPMFKISFAVPMAFLLFSINAFADQASVVEVGSQPNVVQIAVGSKDHKTLVDLVVHVKYDDVLSNPGPFTVFAPTDAAFAALPKGTIETLKKPESKDALQDILEYHVFVGVLKEGAQLNDGAVFNQANLKNIKITGKPGHLQVNGANILGAVKASNGIVYVIDKVLLPPTAAESAAMAAAPAPAETPKAKEAKKAKKTK